MRQSTSDEHRVAEAADLGTHLPAARPAATFDLRGLLWLLYLVGGLACLGWLVLGRVLLRRILWSASPPEFWLQGLYERIPAPRHRPRLLVSERCTRALSFGIRWPTIVLPDVDCRAERTESLRHVLRHELAHSGQGDAWGHLLFNVAFPLLYFHPLFWWLRSRTYLAAELIADDWAAARSAKESYVEALVGLVKQRDGRSFAYFGSPQIFGSRSQFYRRMQMLLSRESPLAPRCSRWWRLICLTACLLAVFVTAAAVGVQPADGQQGPPAETTEGVFGDELVVDTVTPPTEAEESGVPGAEAAEEASDANVATADNDRDELQASFEALRKELSALKLRLAEQQAAKDALMKEFKDFQAAQAAKNKAAVASAVQQLLQKAQTAQPQQTAPSAFTSVLQTLKTTRAAREKEAAIAAHKKALDARKAAQDNAAAAASLLEKGYITAKAAAQAAEELQPIPGNSEAAKTRAQLQRMTSDQASTVRGRTMTLPTMTDTKVLAEPWSPATWTPFVTGPRGGSRGQLDLVGLATAYADAVGNLAIAELRHGNTKELRKAKAISNQEAAIAEIHLETAKRKVVLLQRIAKSALKATEAAMQAVSQQLSSLKRESGEREKPAVEALTAQLIQAESRSDILRSILSAAKSERGEESTVPGVY